MSAVSDLKTWLPMGSAHVIDWKHLGRSASARNATAWVTRVGAEPVLARTWSNESTTYFEFFFLGHESVTGSLLVTTARPQPTRLQVKVAVEVEGRLNYEETTELTEHSRTGLYGVTTRTMGGGVTPDGLEPLTPAHAEIFEFAPESALNTICGAWISDLLAWVFDAASPGAELQPRHEHEIDVSIVAEAPVAEHHNDVSHAPISAPRPPVSGARAPVSAPRPPIPAPELPPAPIEPPSPSGPIGRRSAPSLLVATTTNGDRWEVEGAETYMGRSKQCSIVLKSQRVSRKHASITREDDGFYINDLGAANGIWAGTDKVEREKIEDGSEYIIGDVLVSFNYP